MAFTFVPPTGTNVFSLGGNSVPPANVVAASDYVLLHGNGVRDPERIVEMCGAVATPEPQTALLISWVLAVGAVACRRRRRL